MKGADQVLQTDNAFVAYRNPDVPLRNSVNSASCCTGGISTMSSNFVGDWLGIRYPPLKHRRLRHVTTRVCPPRPDKYPGGNDLPSKSR
jgi:hypothetical protein